MYLRPERGDSGNIKTDEYGALHRMWRVNDPAVIRLLTSTMANKRLIIADGHHRYETALTYSREYAASHAYGRSPHAYLSSSSSLVYSGLLRS